MRLSRVYSKHVKADTLCIFHILDICIFHIFVCVTVNEGQNQGPPVGQALWAPWVQWSIRMAKALML